MPTICRERSESVALFYYFLLLVIDINAGKIKPKIGHALCVMYTAQQTPADVETHANP